jgi:hypothetical protein
MFGRDANNPLMAAKEADPDRDGFSNLLDYALGRQPFTPEPSKQGITRDLHLGQQRLTLNPDPLATDVIPQIQRSTSLIIVQNTVTQVRVRDTSPMTSRSFLKVIATPAP